MNEYRTLQLIGSDGSTHTIASFPSIVGKLRGSDVVVSGNPTVSRSHARILRSGNRFAVEDLGSTNKTYVQGFEAKPGIPLLLSEGDIVCFSDEAYRVHFVANTISMGQFGS